MTGACVDYVMARRIDTVATAIIDTIPLMRPVVQWNGFKRTSFYDLRGRIPEIPDLVVMFVFLDVRASIVPRYIFRGRPMLLLQLPGLGLKALDNAVVRSQTSLHYEIAHVLLKHMELEGADTQRPNKGAAYFNLPEEIDAFLHQAIADFEKAICQLPAGALAVLDRDAAKTVFAKDVHPAFWKALTPRNRASFNQRVDAYLTDRLKDVLSAPGNA